MSSVSIKAVTPTIQHGEGPHWDSKLGVLYYVDTFKADVYRWDPNQNKIFSVKIPERNSVGVVIPVKDKKDEFLVTSDRFIYLMKWDGDERNNDGKSSHKVKHLLTVEAEKPKNQFNDGKCDSLGRLWSGTLTRNDDLSVPPNGGSFYMISLNSSGCTALEEKEKNVSIPNGLAWTKNNDTFYYVDTLTDDIVAYDFDIKSGNISNKRKVFDLKDYPELTGKCDGMTIDSNDNLWVALLGGGAIIQVDPRKGTLERTVKIPATYVTSACFGGPHLDILYVTTSRLKLNENEVDKEPQAGSVFAVTGLGVHGVKENEVVLF